MNGSTETDAVPCLTALIVEPGEIAFDPEIEEYTVSVPSGTQKLLVSAEKEEGITYTVTGNTNLTEGENEVTINVADASGHTRVYRIHVYEGAEEATDLSQTASVISYVSSKENAPIAVAAASCAGIALILWLVYFLKKIRCKKIEKEYRRKRQLQRQKEKERALQARRQEEELLRQIELLTRKSRKMAPGTNRRIIELDESDLHEEEQADLLSDSEDEDE